MLGGFEILVVESWDKSDSETIQVVWDVMEQLTIHNLIRNLGPLLLVMLDQAMGVEGVCDGAVESVVNADGEAVGRHEGRVHFHLLFAVAVAGLFVPFVFVFAFFASVGVELVREVFDGERDGIGVGGGGAELFEGCGGVREGVYSGYGCPMT